MKTINKFLRVDRREICYLKFILEAYDGIATLTTIDAHQGVVMLRIAPGCEDDVEAVLKDLKKNIIIDDTRSSFLLREAESEDQRNRFVSKD